MSEVTKIGQTQRAITKNFSRLLPIKTRGRQSVRSIANKHQHDQSPNNCQQRNKQHVVPPVRTAESVDEIGRRFAQR